MAPRAAEPDGIAALARRRIEAGSKSFAAASRLFDADTRTSATLLYAWCRHCDDEIDDQRLGHGMDGRASPVEERLAGIEARTRAAIAGEATEPEFIALSRVLARHAIPEALPLEHLEGFAMDASRARYRTVDDTLLYSWRVAGVVGVMMAMVMGAREPATLRRAADLGLAFQLTNIARDVMDDARGDRVYLPADWLGEEGIDEAGIADPANRAAVHRVTVRLLDLAERYYASAAHGLADLPFRAALAVAAARSVYRSIGSVVRRRGGEAWDTRAVVGGTGKAAAIAEGAATALWSRTRITRGPLRREGLWTPEMLEDDRVSAWPTGVATTAARGGRDARGGSRSGSK